MSVFEIGLELWELVTIVATLAVVYYERRESRWMRQRMEEIENENRDMRTSLEVFELKLMHMNETIDFARSVLRDASDTTSSAGETERETKRSAKPATRKRSTT